MTDDADPHVRFEVAFALTLLGDPRAAPALRRLAHDPDPQVRETAEGGLNRLRELSGQKRPAGWL